MALYGNVVTMRGICPCGWQGLVDHKNHLCSCGKKLPWTNRVARMTEPPDSRGRPSRKAQDLALIEQGYACFYCERPFAANLRIAWDHWVPFSYNQDNRDLNFVAACESCNSIKNAKVFSTPEEAKAVVGALTLSRFGTGAQAKEEEIE